MESEKSPKYPKNAEPKNFIFCSMNTDYNQNIRKGENFVENTAY